MSPLPRHRSFTSVTTARGAALGDVADEGSLAAVAIVALVVAVMVVAPRLHRAIPASLVAIGLATILAEIAGLDAAIAHARLHVERDAALLAREARS